MAFLGGPTGIIRNFYRNTKTLGRYSSLHLFDVKKFYAEIVPELKGDKGDLRAVYREFLPYHMLGRHSELSHSGIDKIIDDKLSSLFCFTALLNDEFMDSPERLAIKGLREREEYPFKLEGHYDFCRFLEYYIFKTCADYSPFIGLGKGNVYDRIGAVKGSLAESVLSRFGVWNVMLYHEMGIVNWLMPDELTLLYHDLGIIPSEDNALAEGFKKLLKIAYENDLSFIRGVDLVFMNRQILPSGKLLPVDQWEPLSQEGLWIGKSQEAS